MTNLSKRLADSLVPANNGDANLVNKSTLTKCVLVLASVSGLILWAIAPAAAAPLLSNTAAVRLAADAAVAKARWYYVYPSYGYGYSPYYSYGYGSYAYVYGYGYSPHTYSYAPYSYGYNSYAYVPWY